MIDVGLNAIDMATGTVLGITVVISLGFILARKFLRDFKFDARTDVMSTQAVEMNAQLLRELKMSLDREREQTLYERAEREKTAEAYNAALKEVHELQAQVTILRNQVSLLTAQIVDLESTIRGLTEKLPPVWS